MRVGVTKEIVAGERRVALAPDAVARLVASGTEVLVESGAGEEANFSDEMYKEAGAELADNAASLLGSVEVVSRCRRRR